MPRIFHFLLFLEQELAEGGFDQAPLGVASLTAFPGPLGGVGSVTGRSTAKSKMTA